FHGCGRGGCRTLTSGFTATGGTHWPAIPPQAPLISNSDSGVSITRSVPKRCCSPTVARNTPPFTPTSSPSTITFGSSRIARLSARLTASTNVDSGMGPTLQLVTLGSVELGKFGIEVLEHRLWRLWLHRQSPFGPGVNAR